MSRDYDVQRVDTGLEQTCAICLLDDAVESYEVNEAVTVVLGTATCGKHVQQAVDLY